MRKQLLRPPLAPDTKAERLMSHPPVLKPKTRVQNAIALVFQSGCDLLPVIEDGKLMGAVFARDLVFLDKTLNQMTVGDLGQTKSSGIPEDITISEAASHLRDLDMESLPLVDVRGDLRGWISFPDIHRYVIAPEKGVRGTGEFVAEKLHPMRNPVAPLAKSSGLTVSPEANLHEVAGLLCSRKCNEFTVIDGVHVLAHVNVLEMLSLTRGTSDLLVQVAGLEEEEPLVVGQILENLRSTTRKLQKICRNVEMPEIKVKSYMHRGSNRKRYEVRVAFSVPEQYVAEAKGWDLLSVSQQAIKKVEREIVRGRSRLIQTHRRRRTRPAEEV